MNETTMACGCKMTSEQIGSRMETRFLMCPLHQAAPDLLATLREWVDYMEALDADHEPGDPLVQMRQTFHRKRMERSRAAIAAAIGRTSP